jgi:hypothetical protein
MSPPGRHGLVLVAGMLAGMLAASGCSGADPGPEETTPPMLAAAVLAHTEAELVAAAQVLPGEVGRGVGPEDLAAEVALARPEEGTTHVRVVVTEGEPLGSRADVRRLCRTYGPCEDVSTDVAEATLLFENGAVDSDPGRVYAWARWEDRTVWAYAYGPFVDAEPQRRTPEVEALGETLVALVTDPDVGFSTSQAYADDSAELCEDGWLEWYGQGNGAPEPEDNPDWC